ncbi:LIM domain only protein 3 [Fasciola gigantica]|uniref:LIM domain only protein 3 n=1 Tax=Fasciola gigantica TaxID=46835 RepID=A0A504YT66_FASGI|nr:LIM domain only protein 3 [Fasciola gigantica]
MRGIKDITALNPTSTATSTNINTATNSNENSSCTSSVASSRVIHLPIRCFKCKQVIREAHLLLADKQYWHEDCLRCVCCEVRLAELDKHFYVKADMPLCRRDYLRLYGQTGECFVCRKRILAFEFVMRIQNKVYHLNCFSCQQCQLRFCVGDKFYLHNQFILCEQDYTYMMLAFIQPTFLLPIATRNALTPGRFTQSRLPGAPTPISQSNTWQTFTTKEPIPCASLNTSETAMCTESVELASLDKRDSGQYITQSFPVYVKPPTSGSVKTEITDYEVGDGMRPVQIFDESNQLWPVGDFPVPNATNPIGHSDDHSSGYGSPSPTLSNQLELR